MQKKNNPEISIIIPVYNEKKYIEQCIESLLNQTVRNFELILVDDGSIDGTLEIEEQYCYRDERIKLIKKKHTNAGEARNEGMKAAKGNYITFLDSDDYYELDLLEKQLSQITRDNADICVCDADFYNDNSGNCELVDYLLMKEFLPEKIPFSPKICSDRIFQIIATAPWVRLYRLEFIKANQIKYQSLERANDVYFSNMALALAEKITVVNRVLVHHRIGLITNLQNGLKSTPDIYLDANLAVKKKLTEKQLYNDFEESYILYLINNIRAIFEKFSTQEEIMQLVRGRFETGIITETGIIDFFEKKVKATVDNPESYDIRLRGDLLLYLDLFMKWPISKDEKIVVHSLLEKLSGVEAKIREGRPTSIELFPFEYVPRGSKIVIYGAGAIGKMYIQQIILSKWSEIIGISGRDQASIYLYPFIEKNQLCNNRKKFDYIVIAIKDNDEARKVKKELIEEGLDEDILIYCGDSRYTRGLFFR